MIISDAKTPKGRSVGPAAPHGDRDHGALGDGIYVTSLGHAVPPVVTLRAKLDAWKARRRAE